MSDPTKKVDVEIEVSPEDLEKLKSSPKNANPKAEKMKDQASVIADVMAKIKHKIIVCSGKGGVGKSTVATNLAVSLAAQGLAVGILDVDITGPNVPKMLNLEGMRPEVIPGANKFRPVIGPLHIQGMSMSFLLETPDTPVIWRGPLKMGAIRQFIADADWDALDYLIADLPPGTSDETLDIMQLTQGEVVVVTTPQEVATLDARKTIQMSKTMNLNVVGVVENMSGFAIKCPHCDKPIEVDLFGKGGGEKASKDLDVPFLGRIPIEPAVREQGDLGVPVVMQYSDSASAIAIEEIVKKIRASVE